MRAIGDGLDNWVDEISQAEPPPEEVCGDCGGPKTPRQFGSEGRWCRAVFCEPCIGAALAKRDRLERERHLFEQKRDLATLMHNAKFSPRHLGYYDQQAAKMRPVCERLADQLSEGRCIFLTGEYGTRKSTLAVGVGVAFAHRHMKVRFWGEEQMIGALQAGSSRGASLPASQIVEEAQQTELLIWDDFGMRKRRSEAVDDWTQAIASHRYDSMRSTVYTSNTSIEDVGEMVGERTARRIVETCLVIRVTANGLEGLPK